MCCSLGEWNARISHGMMSWCTIEEDELGGPMGSSLSSDAELYKAVTKQNWRGIHTALSNLSKEAKNETKQAPPPSPSSSSIPMSTGVESSSSSSSSSAPVDASSGQLGSGSGVGVSPSPPPSSPSISPSSPTSSVPPRVIPPHVKAPRVVSPSSSRSTTPRSPKIPPNCVNPKSFQSTPGVTPDGLTYALVKCCLARRFIQQESIIKDLVHYGASPNKPVNLDDNASPHYYCALHAAVSVGNVHLIDGLLMLGANINGIMIYKDDVTPIPRSPLLVAILANAITCATHLLDSGCDYTPLLRYAAKIVTLPTGAYIPAVQHVIKLHITNRAVMTQLVELIEEIPASLGVVLPNILGPHNPNPPQEWKPRDWKELILRSRSADVLRVLVNKYPLHFDDGLGSGQEICSLACWAVDPNRRDAVRDQSRATLTLAAIEEGMICRLPKHVSASIGDTGTYSRVVMMGMERCETRVKQLHQHLIAMGTEINSSSSSIEQPGQECSESSLVVLSKIPTVVLLVISQYCYQIRLSEGMANAKVGLEPAWSIEF